MLKLNFLPLRVSCYCLWHCLRSHILMVLTYVNTTNVSPSRVNFLTNLIYTDAEVSVLRMQWRKMFKCICETFINLKKWSNNYDQTIQYTMYIKFEMRNVFKIVKCYQHINCLIALHLLYFIMVLILSWLRHGKNYFPLIITGQGSCSM
jgi:hypothetical protein